MTISVADLLIRVRTDTTGALGGLNALSLGLIGLGVGAAAAATAMVRMGMDAQNQLAIVAGFTGSTTAQMAQYTAGLENISTSLGVTMTEAAKGLYYVVSAGFQGAAALNILKIAEEASIASGADLQTVANGLTSAMNSYGAGANQAGKYSDIMVLAVTYGKQTFDQFAGSIGKAAAYAAALHIPFQDLAAAEASLTEKGIPANIAMTNMQYLLQHLYEPVSTLEKAVKAAGGSFDATKYSALDLMGRLEYLYTQTGLNASSFVTLIGGVRSSKEAFTLLADGGTSYNRILAAMNTQVNATANAFQVHTQTMAYGFQMIAAAISVTSLKLIQFLTPFASPILLGIAALINNLTDKFVSLSPSINAAATTINTTVIPAFIAFSGWVEGHVLPVLQQLSDWFMVKVAPALEVVADWVMQRLVPALGQLWDWIGAKVLPVLEQLIDIALQHLVPAFGILGELLITKIVPALEAVWEGLSPMLIPAMERLGRAIDVLVPIAAEMIGWLADLVTWAMKNQVALDIIKGTIYAIGIVLAAIKFVSFIQGLISFITWIDTAAWAVYDLVASLAGVFGALVDILEIVAAAVGITVGAFVAVVAIVLAVVAAVILAIVYHKQLGEMFSWLGSEVQDFIHGPGSGLGEFFDGLGTKVHDAMAKVVSAVGDAFSNLGTSVTNSEASTGNAIGGFFSALGSDFHAGLDALGADFGAFFSGLGTWLSEHVKDTEKSITDWWTSVETYWEDGITLIATDWTNFWDPTGTFFSAFGTAIQNFIQAMGTNFSDLGTGMHKAWDQLIASPLGQQVGGTFSNIGSSVSSFFNALGTTFKTGLDAIGSTVGNAFSSIGTKFKAGLDAIGSTVGSFFSALGTQFKTGLNAIGAYIGGGFSTLGSLFHTGLDEMSADVGSFFSWLGGQFKTGLNEIGADVGSFFSLLGTQFKTGISKIDAYVGSFFSWLGGQFKTGLDEIGAAVGTFFNFLGTQFKAGLNEIGGYIGTAFESFGISVQISLKDITDVVGAWFNTLGTVFHAGLNVVLGIINSFMAPYIAQFQGLFNTLRDLIGNFMSWMGATIHAGLSVVGNDIGAQFSAYGTLINQTLNNIKNAIAAWSSGLIKDWGAVWNAVNYELGGALDTAWSAIQKFVGNVMSTIGTFINGQNGLIASASTWGSSMLNGFTSGISNAWGGFLSAIHRFFGDGNSRANDGSLVGYVKGLLGIHSPSTVFAELGGQMLQGLINGFSGNNLTNSIGGFINTSLGGIGGVISSLVKNNVIDLTQMPLKGWDFIKSLGGNLFSGLQSLLGSASGPAGTGNMSPINIGGNVVQWLMQAMADTGVPESWLTGLEIIAQHESGGNPNAVNRTDSNWLAGHPSMGLMQTIMSTFLANALPGHTSIFNPIDNAIAAIRYIEKVYGGINNVPGVRAVETGHSYVGYDNGGWINEPISGIGRSGRHYRFGESGPEYVSPSGRTAPAGKTVHFENHFYGSNLTVQDVVREQSWQMMLHGG